MRARFRRRARDSFSGTRLGIAFVLANSTAGILVLAATLIRFGDLEQLALGDTLLIAQHRAG